MANTVIGLYNDSSTAERVIEDLTNSGFERSIIDMHRENDAAGLHDELTDEGIPNDDADYYVEGLRDGGVLVSVHADESDTDKAVDIMNRYANESGYEDKRALDGADINSDASRLSGSDAGSSVDSGTDREVSGNTGSTSGTDRSTERNLGSANTSDDETIEVAEEQMRVGKRKVQRGGVRVRSRVVEEEVSEDVTLRDEKVNVDRQSVDRDASSADGDLFQERTIEMTETDEEAVIDKVAHVTEEIHVNRTAEDHTETVRDTVRRTEVDVDDIDGDTVQDDASSTDTTNRS